jgi:hypothetical protein
MSEYLEQQLAEVRDLNRKLERDLRMVRKDRRRAYRLLDAEMARQPEIREQAAESSRQVWQAKYNTDHAELHVLLNKIAVKVLGRDHSFTGEEILDALDRPKLDD